MLKVIVSVLWLGFVASIYGAVPVKPKEVKAKKPIATKPASKPALTCKARYQWGVILPKGFARKLCHKKKWYWADGYCESPRALGMAAFIANPKGTRILQLNQGQKVTCVGVLLDLR